MAKLRIGISGWRYPPWRGVFYPEDLPQREELAFASKRFTSIELNGSFYALQRPSSYLNWYQATPENFVFSVKATRYITHILRLREIEKPLANFLASGLLNLKEKLGPILWQFPPSLRYDAELFEKFLTLLPHDTTAAAALAREREPRMHGRDAVTTDRKRPLRHAVEARHASFVDPAFVQQLRRHKVALVVADTAGKWPRFDDVTADFMYLRLHGDKKLYASGYTGEALARWARFVAAWHRGSEPRDAMRTGPRATAMKTGRPRDIYCYFDNDIKVKAPFDAQALRRKLKLPDAGPALPAAPALPKAAKVKPPPATGRRRSKP